MKDEKHPDASLFSWQSWHYTSELKTRVQCMQNPPRKMEMKMSRCIKMIDPKCQLSSLDVQYTYGMYKARQSLFIHGQKSWLRCWLRRMTAKHILVLCMQ